MDRLGVGGPGQARTKDILCRATAGQARLMPPPTVAYYSFDARRTSAIGGGTDIFCASLERFFDAQRGRIELVVVPVVPNQATYSDRLRQLGGWLAGLVRDYATWWTVDADVHVLVYPKLPVLAFTDKPWLLRATRFFYHAWARRVTRRGQRIAVIVEDLPAEQGFGPSAPEKASARTPQKMLEQAVFCSSNALVVASQRFADYILTKHPVDRGRIMVFRRNIYMPPQALAASCPVEPVAGINVLYSGGLDERMALTFREVLAVFARHSNAQFWICGPGQSHVTQWIDEVGAKNARHLGTLDHATHDALAQNCDFGLLLYPRSFYNDMTPTMKYSGYAANGLAILSTDLATVADNLREDGIGRAAPVTEVPGELERWLDQPARFERYRASARDLAHTFRQGVYMQEWLDQVLAAWRHDA